MKMKIFLPQLQCGVHLKNTHTHTRSTNSVVHFHRIGFFATKLKLVGQFAYNIHNRPFSLNEKKKTKTIKTTVA